MTSDFSSLDDQLLAATAELDQTVAQARVDLADFQRAHQPTAEDTRALQEAAASGDLGFDLEELARLIDEGRDSWAAVFSGQSPNADLLRGLLERTFEENADSVRTALEQDPDFDPDALPGEQRED